MAKKNMDILLGNILGDGHICTQDKTDKQPVASKVSYSKNKRPKVESEPLNEDSWRHFSFICSKELVDKVQAIAHKEGFTIRAFMEYVMKQGIDAYESKHGKVKKIRMKDIKDVM